MWIGAWRSHRFDEALDGIDGVFIPKRRQESGMSFTYIFCVERRDGC